jgi:hypothetical protein
VGGGGAVKGDEVSGMDVGMGACSCVGLSSERGCDASWGICNESLPNRSTYLSRHRSLYGCRSEFAVSVIAFSDQGMETAEVNGFPLGRLIFNF